MYFPLTLNLLLAKVISRKWEYKVKNIRKPGKLFITNYMFFIEGDMYGKNRK